MSDVIFEEDTVSAVRPIASHVEKPSFILQMVYKTGLAKDKKEARILLVGVIIACIVLSMISLFVGGII